MKGIIFSQQLIPLILSGQKTVTRRLSGLESVNGWPDDWQYIGLLAEFEFTPDPRLRIKCKPRYLPGEIVYLKETWIHTASQETGDYLYSGNKTFYKSAGNLILGSNLSWKSPLMMPEKFSRCHLLIKDVRAERLQKITEEDAVKEGISAIYAQYQIPMFADLWDSINDKHKWENNPWCWVYTFERTDNI